MKSSKDIINFRVISEMLTGNPDTIRSNRIPKKYLDKVKELQTLIDYWISKNKSLK